MPAEPTVRQGSASAGVATSTLHVRLDYVRSHYSAEVVAQLLARATPALRGLLEAPPSGDGFTELEHFLALNELIQELVGSSDGAVVRAMGHFAARHNASTWRKIFESGADIPTFMTIASGLWHHHYDSGVLHLVQEGPSALTLEIRDFAVPHRAHCLSVLGWLEGIFEADPKHLVTVTERACRALGDERCVLALSYRDAR